MFKHRLLNLFVAVALAAAVIIVFSVRQAGATKSVIPHANTTTSTVRYIGGEPAYRLPNGQWVR